MPPEASTAAPTVILQGWVPLLTLIVALLAPLGPAILSLWVAHRNSRKLNVINDRTAKQLDVIHGLVNSRLSAALNKIDDLERRLFEADGTPPSGEPPILAADPGDYPIGPAT